MSAVCAVSLFAQAINLVLSVLLPGIYTPIGVVIFFLIIECIPAGFLLHLYGISSDFVKRKEKVFLLVHVHVLHLTDEGFGLVCEEAGDAEGGQAQDERGYH